MSTKENIHTKLTARLTNHCICPNEMRTLVPSNTSSRSLKYFRCSRKSTEKYYITITLFSSMLQQKRKISGKSTAWTVVCLIYKLKELYTMTV